MTHESDPRGDDQPNADDAKRSDQAADDKTSAQDTTGASRDKKSRDKEKPEGDEKASRDTKSTSRGKAAHGATARSREQSAEEVNAPLVSRLEGLRPSIDLLPPADPRTSLTFVPLALRVATAWAWRLGLIGVFLFALGRVLGFFHLVVVPLFAAILLTALLMPQVQWMTKRKVPRPLAVIVTLLGFLGAIAATVMLVADQFAAGLPELMESADEGFAQLQRWLATAPGGIDSQQVAKWMKEAQAALTEHRGEILSQAAVAGTAVGEGVAGFVLCLFATVFFLWEGERMWASVTKTLRPDVRDLFDRAFVRGWRSLVLYVRAIVFVAVTNAFFIAVGAMMLKVPLAVPIGVVVLLGGFVPILGTIVGGAVAVLVALVAKGPTTALLMLLVLFVIHELEKQILQPFLMGKAVEIHPLAVLIALSIGILWAGIAGGVFAVPLVAIANGIMAEFRNAGQANKGVSDASSDDKSPPDEESKGVPAAAT